MQILLGRMWILLYARMVVTFFDELLVEIGVDLELLNFLNFASFSLSDDKRTCWVFPVVKHNEVHAIFKHYGLAHVKPLPANILNVFRAKVVLEC